MVELIINGNNIELPENTEIKYTKQISDIFDIAKVSVSHTNSFEFDKTIQNTQAMNQLGISGDTSNVPYQKNTAVLKSDGFDLISKGWYNVSETADKYKGSVLSGMVDFFKAIENKTIGVDLDLTNFNHIKNLANFISSQINDYYRYIVADYGGKNFFDGGINIDYQSPSFSVRKLWELIFSTFGFNCDYTNLSYINNLWITYPKDTDEGSSDTLVATLIKNNYVSRGMVVSGDIVRPLDTFLHWDSSTITSGNLVDNWSFVATESGNYKLDLAIEMYIKRRFSYTVKNPFTLIETVYTYYFDYDNEITIKKNGLKVNSLPISGEQTTGEERESNIILYLNVGDVISIDLNADIISALNIPGGSPYEWHHNKTTFKIYKTDLGTTKLENEFKDFQIKDFIKEILWRTGLTPVYNYETNTVSFITLNSRLNFNNAQDLSHTFINRESENYISGYAQKNVFALKKNNDFDKYGDGYLFVNNVNIDESKTIAQSKLYAPDNKIITEFINTGFLPLDRFESVQYKIWDAETKVNNNDEIEISYKGLSGRFYFLRPREFLAPIRVTSEKLNDSGNSFDLNYAVNNNTLFDESIYNNYQYYQKIFNNFRIHNIKQALTINDFLGLDMTKPVFFKQENAYYICNKISFEEGKMTTNEFIKINKI